MKKLISIATTFISKYYMLVILLSFVGTGANLSMLMPSYYNVFAIFAAGAFIICAVKIVIWNFGDVPFVMQRGFKKHKKEDEKRYRESCLDTAAEALCIAVISTILAVILMIILIFVL